MDSSSKPITVLGSANYDVFIKVQRPPQVGETISSNELYTAPGGKGANQATAIGKLGFPVNFIGQIGDDSPGTVLSDGFKSNNVNSTGVRVVPNTPSGQAYIMSYPDGNNSIIIIGGANAKWEGNDLSSLNNSLKSKSSLLLLQREVPEEINIKAAKMAKENKVPVILDVGGEDSPISNDLLSLLDIISPNDTELNRIAVSEDTKISNIQDIDSVLACIKAIRSNSNNPNLEFLLKLGADGSMFIAKDNSIIRQKAIKIPDLKIVDTCGAGDCFTGSFAVKYSQNSSDKKGCMHFASACALVCITRFGATPSMPSLKDVEEVLSKEIK